MRKLIVNSLLCPVLLFMFSSSASAFDMATISGSAQFKSSLLSKYMKKHGYSFLEEVLYNGRYKTNLFAAKEAEVIVKNKYGSVLASGITDHDGHFSLSVPRDNNYQILVRFHDREIEDLVSYSDVNNYTADFGHFKTETVESWFFLPPLTYCYSCNIRHLEMNESM